MYLKSSLTQEIDDKYYECMSSTCNQLLRLSFNKRLETSDRLCATNKCIAYLNSYISYLNTSGIEKISNNPAIEFNTTGNEQVDDEEDHDEEEFNSNSTNFDDEEEYEEESIYKKRKKKSLANNKKKTKVASQNDNSRRRSDIEEIFDSEIKSCPHCSFNTNNHTDYQNHMSQHEDKEVSLKCRYCDYFVTTSSDLLNHEVIHLEYVQRENNVQIMSEKYPCKTEKVV